MTIIFMTFVDCSKRETTWMIKTDPYVLYHSLEVSKDQNLKSGQSASEDEFVLRV